MKYDHCEKCRDEVVWYALLVNIGQAFFKGALGVISGSAALVADSFHSAADVIASSVTMISLKISSKPADKEHPYGHGQAQYISSAIVGMILLGGALALLVGSIKNIISGDVTAPGKIALFGALISVSLNELMYRYQSCVGKENNSPAILANAWDNRSDAFSSIAVMTGITFAILGYPIADPLAAIGVSLVVIKIGVELNMVAVNGLMDSSPELEDLKEIYNIARGVPGVAGISYLRARSVGESLHVDIELVVDGELKVYEGDLIVDLTKDKITDQVDNSDEVQVYLSPEPIKEKKREKNRNSILGLLRKSG
ncbi:MAG TPA: magnetosome biogenesis CDF transporter MamB [Nitrospirae bacterium]|nr:magnetosome biogenesis CDF transporter MamB [Nitrospirota bacterium]